MDADDSALGGLAAGAPAGALPDAEGIVLSALEVQAGATVLEVTWTTDSPTTGTLSVWRDARPAAN